MAGLVLGLFGHSWPWYVAGWALGGVVALLLLGRFISADAARRTTGLAESSPLTLPLLRGLVLLALAAVVLNAWFFADQIARLPW